MPVLSTFSSFISFKRVSKAVFLIHTFRHIGKKISFFGLPTS